MTKFIEQADEINARDTPLRKARDSFERRVFRATVIVLATVAAAYVLWALVDVLLLLFACALVALILLTITNALQRRIGLPFRLALGAATLGLLGLLAGAFTFFGATLQGEFAEIAQRLPVAWAELQARLQSSPAGAALVERVQRLAPSGQVLVSGATRVLAAVGGGISGLAIVLVGGLYLAAQPRLYSGGLLRMVPHGSRTRVAETLDAVTVSLRNWLKGQGLGMLFVGCATGLGLWLAGVPAAWAIGLIAGLAEFVPYLGILVAGVPAVVLAFGQGAHTGL